MREYNFVSVFEWRMEHVILTLLGHSEIGRLGTLIIYRLSPLSQAPLRQHVLV